MRMIFRVSAAVVAVASTLAFNVVTVEEPVPESNPVARTVVTDGRTQFSFIVPRGWRMRAEATEKRISLESLEPRGVMAVRLMTNGMPATAGALKARVVKDYREVVVMEEFTAASGGDPGLGIDFRHQPAAGVAVAARLAVYAAPGGSIEASVTAAAGDLEKLHLAWTGFINSLRVGGPARK